MASPLTVTASTAATAIGKPFGAPAANGNEDTTKFAALLGEEPKPTAPAATRVDAAPPSPETGDSPQNPEPIAAVIDAPQATQPVFDATPLMTGLAEDLASLKTALEAGETPDPALLDRIDVALEQLAAAFGVSLEQLPTSNELAAMAAAAKTGTATELTTALAPMAGQLLADTTTPEVKALGEKLAALLAAIDQGAIPDDALAQLRTDTALDPALEAALAKLAAKPLVDPTPNAQPLATPQLTLDEPVLTGKSSADTAPPADEPRHQSGTDTVEKPANDARADTERQPDTNTSSDDKPRDKTVGAVAAPIDQQADTQVVAPGAQQAARLDAIAAPRVIQAGYQTSQQQLNLPQLAFEIVRQATDGNTRFQIRLDPAELGRIDVRLDIDASGQVNARLTVERAETLDLMQRDQRGLERALQQAGLDASKTTLEFSLKQNSSGNQQGQNGEARGSLFGGQNTETEQSVLPTINLYRGNLSASGVNIIA